jgi:hypothetical protein
VATQYPKSPVSFTTKVDLQDVVRAADVNVLYREVEAIAADLGQNDGGLKTSGVWGLVPTLSTTTVWSGVGPRIQNLENAVYTVYNNYVDKRGGTTITAADSVTKPLVVKGRGASAVVTAATSTGTQVQYVASNTFKAGETVTVTGLGITSGVSLNLTGVVLSQNLSNTDFYFASTVTASVASGTGTALAVESTDLQQWQNGSGTVVARITHDGLLKTPAISGGTP